MPFLVSITTDIPKAKIFRFENYWMMHDKFMQKVARGWDFPIIEGDQIQKLQKGTKAMACSVTQSK
jgi:hypothetical protein